MNEAVEMVRKFLNDPMVRGAMTNEEMEHQQDVEDAKKNGIKLGIEQGQRDEAIAIAKNLIKLGYDDEKISLVTDLSIEIIRNLRLGD